MLHWECGAQHVLSQCGHRRSYSSSSSLCSRTHLASVVNLRTSRTCSTVHSEPQIWCKVSMTSISQQDDVTGPTGALRSTDSPEHLKELQQRVWFAQTFLIFTNIWIHTSEPQASSENQCLVTNWWKDCVPGAREDLCCTMVPVWGPHRRWSITSVRQRDQLPLRALDSKTEAGLPG